MALEQIEGRRADARSDIFAFGVVLYEMLTGRRPFTGDTPAQVMSAILRDEPVRITALRPALPATLDHAVGACLVKDPEQRWQNARDVALALTSIGVVHPTRSLRSTPARWERRAWVAAMTSYLGSAIIGLGFAVATWSAHDAVLIGLYLAVTLTAAIRSEESHLTEKFGDAYPDYRMGRGTVVSRALQRAPRCRE